MSEKRFTLEQWTEESLYFSDGEYSAHMSIEYICKKVEKKLNEQQATINKLREENEQLRRLFEEMKQPITINLTEEDEKELRKLLGLIDDE